MEMIDVLKRLQEITDKSPEVKEAIKSTEAMNPKQQAAIAISKKEKMKEHCTDFADFLRREGQTLDKMDVSDITAMADKYAQHKMDVAKDESVDEASDTQVAAQQAVEEYLDGDTLVKPKNEVIADLMKRAKESSFPKSYEFETAARIVADKYDDDGDEKYQPEPDMQSINTNTMETKDKKPVKEAIQMTADTPQEASMLMQILQMAGIKPMGADMPNKMTMPSDEPEHGSEMDPGALNKQMDMPGDDDAMGSMQMAKMRDMVMQPDQEKKDETFANSPGDREKDEPKIKDIDTLVNVHSGGLNRQKAQYRKEYPGDNPMAAEDKITEQDLANSLRNQYESFKASYQEAAKVAETKAKPDYIDLDKDGNKTEPMKKAAKDKEAKEKK